MVCLNLNIFDVSYNFKAGDIAPFTVVSEKNLEYIDTHATQEKREEVRKTVLPVFDQDMTIYDTKATLLEEAVGTVTRRDLTREEKLEKLQSILKPLIGEKNLDDFDYTLLLKYGRRKGYLERMKSLLYNLYQNGIYKPIQDNYDLEEYSKKLVPVRIIEENQTRRDFKQFSDFIYSDISYFEFFSYMRKKMGNRKDLKGYVDLLYLLLEDNLYINTFFTEKEITTKLKRVHPVIKTIKEDEVIVRKGDRINQEILDKIKALKFSKRKNFIKKLAFTLFLSIFIIITLNVGLQIIYPSLFKDHKKMTLFYLFIITNILIIYLFFNLLSHFTFPLGILFPIGITVFILSITMERKLAYLANGMVGILYVAFLVVYRVDTLYSVFYILIIGTFMTLLSSNIQRRDQVIQSSLYAMLPYLLFTGLYVFYFPNYIETTHISSAFLWSVFNPIITSVLAIGLIPVFEKVFNMVTPFRLMELSNLSNKVLSDMHLLAPGTYHHCILVSHLVESACKEIGANHLLGRVGSLYHDIGKLSNPKYFAENMEFGDCSIHEEISPQFSASILKKHIVEGLRMARELNLPEEVIRFIPEHHGSSLMQFFYEKARENAPEGEEVDEAAFRYSRSNPRTKETAILMLSDGIEAGVRALKSKRYDLIKAKISQIITDRINSGALSDSPLTMRDLKTIEVVFQKLLFAYYHVRPSYPKDKELEEEVKNEESNGS
jgi:putative nucleotidyltransferase with HDIG domain